MGLTTSKINPDDYRVPLQSALDGKADQEIGERLQRHGFVIFRLDEAMHKHVLNFFSQGKEFFSLPAEEKRKYLAEQDPIRCSRS
jgi:isopenicillin N synthase-like dioxygenase